MADISNEQSESVNNEMPSPSCQLSSLSSSSSSSSSSSKAPPNSSSKESTATTMQQQQQQQQFKSGGHYAFNAPANGASFNGGSSYAAANGRAPSFRRGGGARGGAGGAAAGGGGGGGSSGGGGGGSGQYYGRANSWNNGASGAFNGEPQKSHGIEKKIFNDGESTLHLFQYVPSWQCCTLGKPVGGREGRGRREEGRDEDWHVVGCPALWRMVSADPKKTLGRN